MEKRNPREWLCLKRTVRFGETDAAGVVHFLELFRWCHETWEESLERYGIVLQEIFPTNKINRTGVILRVFRTLTLIQIINSAQNYIAHSRHEVEIV